MKLEEAKDFLRSNGWLAEEPKWVKDAVLAASELVHHAPGDFTHHVGDSPGGIHGIATGGYGVLLPTAGQELALCHILRPGIWFGHGPVLSGKERSLGFQAVEPSSAIFVPLAGLSKLIAEQPDLKLRLAALSDRNFAFAIRTIGDLLIPSSERRIAAVLVRISGPMAAGQKTPYPIRISQAEIGQIANASRDRVNVALSKFAKQGWITVDFKLIQITNLAALEAHAAARQ